MRKEPFAVNSAWRGLECHAKNMIDPIGPVSTIVEVGVDWGYSFFSFCEMFRNADVIGVDNFCFSDGDESRSHVESWLPSYPNAALIPRESGEACQTFCIQWPNQPIDVLHIDADHLYESVARDFDLWVPLVRDGGVVLFHDVATDFRDLKHGGLLRSVRHFFEELQGKKDMVPCHSGLGAWYKEMT